MHDRKPALVVYAWDGKSAPLGPVVQDTAPEFDLLLFDYSGKATAPEAVPVLSVKTACKGEIYREVYRWLEGSPTTYEYVGLLDDDIEISWSGINHMLRIARSHGLDCFAASLSHDSHYSHAKFLNQGTAEVRPIAWVEVMMPFYRTQLFMAGGAYYENSISSYALDQFVMTALQKLTGHGSAAVIDAVVARHVRPITSDDKVFANGLTAHQERPLQRRRAMAQVAAERPDLVGSRWYFQTFSPWGGPARFWPLRLLASWLWLQALPHRLRMPAANAPVPAVNAD